MKKNLGEEVANRLRQEIIKGYFKPGEHLVERYIAQRLGVSRTPVREAIRNLISEGLLEVEPNRGAFVSNLDLEAIKELYGIRAVLESWAGRVAVWFINNNDLVELDKMQDDMRISVREGNYRKLNEINSMFHFRLYSVTPHKRLMQMIKELWNNVKRMRATTLYMPDRAIQVLNEHDQILAMLRKKDGVAVEQLIRTHVLRALEVLIELEGGTWEPLEKHIFF